jgi:hypothetical protein
MDTDDKARALQHDIEALEHSAEHAAERLARRAAPYALAVVVLIVFAWLAGRRSRKA